MNLIIKDKYGYLKIEKEDNIKILIDKFNIKNIKKNYYEFNIKIKKSYSSIKNKPDINKILKINNIKDFDKFNETYLILNTKEKTVDFNWLKLKKDYGGILIKHDIIDQYYPNINGKIDIRDRFYTIPINNIIYMSWVDTYWYDNYDLFIIFNIDLIKSLKYNKIYDEVICDFDVI